MLRKIGSDDNLSKVACPACGCIGDFANHGKYCRWIIFKKGSAHIVIPRVRCRSCKKTHAILPQGIVPYKAYSENFMLYVLYAWAYGMSNKKIRDLFGITETTRRRIVSNARRRACALLACGASRQSVLAALKHAGIYKIAAKHQFIFDARFGENVRLNNPTPSQKYRSRPFT